MTIWITHNVNCILHKGKKKLNYSGTSTNNSRIVAQHQTNQLTHLLQYHTTHKWAAERTHEPPSSNQKQKLLFYQQNNSNVKSKITTDTWNFCTYKIDFKLHSILSNENNRYLNILHTPVKLLRHHNLTVHRRLIRFHALCLCTVVYCVYCRLSSVWLRR